MVAKPGLVGSSAKLYLYSNNLNSILILYLHLHFYSNDTHVDNCYTVVFLQFLLWAFKQLSLGRGELCLS